MKRLNLTFALLLVMTGGFPAQEVAKQPIHAAKAGEFVVEPPTLICLGFEWADHRRRQPERDRGGQLPARPVRAPWQRRHAAAADGRRADLPRAATPCRTASPAASSTSSRIRRTRCG